MKNLLKQLNKIAKTIDVNQFYAISMHSKIGKYLPDIRLQGDYNAKLIETLKAANTSTMTENNSFINFKIGNVEFTFEKTPNGR